MSIDTIIYLILGTVAGGFVNGLAGFGSALFSLGFFLTVLPPVSAIAIVLVHSVVSGLNGIWIVREAIMANRMRLVRFLAPAILGIPFGLKALDVVSADALKVLIGCFLVIYGGFFSLRRALPNMLHPTHVLDVIIGFISGVLGGAASLSGALPTMWCSMRPWSKQETRAVLQPFNVIVLCLAAVLLAFQGGYTREIVTLALLTLPLSVISAEIGIAVFRRLSSHRFRRLLIALSLFSGIILLLQQLPWRELV